MVEFYTAENMMLENQQAAGDKHSHRHRLAFSCSGTRAGVDERSGNRTNNSKWLCKTTGMQMCICGYRWSRNADAFPLSVKTILSFTSVTIKLGLAVQVAYIFTGKIVHLIWDFYFPEC